MLVYAYVCSYVHTWSVNVHVHSNVRMHIHSTKVAIATTFMLIIP